MTDAHHREHPRERSAEDSPVSAPSLTRRQFLKRTAVSSLALGGGLALSSCATTTARLASARSTPTPSPIPSPTPTPDLRPVSVAITGDLMLARSVNARMMATTDRFPFNFTADYLHGFDLTVGNLECVVSHLGQPQPKEFTFEANPRAFGRLSAAGFDIVSVANNHSGDFGKSAFADMLGNLTKHGIAYVGGGMNQAEAHAGTLTTTGETTIGMLAYCEIGPTSFAATSTTPGHAWLDVAAMRADIAQLRKSATFVIVFMHWGIEYQPVETAHQQAMARVAIDAGADLVVGAHPHIIQPWEMYRGKLIVYSIGNFVFDEMYGVEAVGNVLVLSIQGHRLVEWHFRQAQIQAYGQPVWA